MYLLMSDGFIRVHRGGYEQSRTMKGSPGAVYQPRTLSDLEDIFTSIRMSGAVVELTDLGRAQGAWDAVKGFCVEGVWEFAKVEEWTAPAADSTGVIVTHIRVQVVFHPSRLGRATRGINPLGLTLTREEGFKAAKFNRGWRLVDGE
jgi:hypothetical protein